MAIDTAEKRRSLIGPSYHYYNPGVTPNALTDAEWRQQSGHGFSGIAANEPTITVVGTGDILIAAVPSSDIFIMPEKDDILIVPAQSDETLIV